jgi:aryl-alcohol dehydrogenase-like predicted oxidoreductase
MNLVTIPSTDLKVSEICLGSGDFGGTINRANSFSLMDTFVENGGNFIDTAHVYNNWIPGEKSRSEKTIGKWMKERRNRAQIILATKGAHPELSHMHIGRLSPDEIVRDLDESLSFLQVEYVDLYWLHRDDPARPVEEIMETLNSQVKAGKIRYVGASNWRTARLKSAQEYAQKSGLKAFCADQVLWNAAVLNREKMLDKTTFAMDPELHQYHQESGLAAIPYSSQANGLFDHMAKNTLIRMNHGVLSQYPLEENRQRLETMRKIAQDHGLSVNQVVLAFLLSQPFPTIPIVGPKRMDHLLDCLQAAGIRLPGAFEW